MPSDIKPERTYALCSGEQVPYKDLYQFPNSHIMGEIRMIADQRAFALYTTPVRAVHVPPVSPDIAAYIIGKATLIRCRHEGCKRFMYWHLDQDVESNHV